MKIAVLSLLSLAGAGLTYLIFQSEFITDIGGGSSRDNTKGIVFFMAAPVIALILGISMTFGSRSAKPITAVIIGAIVTYVFFGYVTQTTDGDPGYMFPGLHIVALPISIAGYVIAFGSLGIAALIGR